MMIMIVTLVFLTVNSSRCRRQDAATKTTLTLTTSLHSTHLIKDELSTASWAALCPPLSRWRAWGTPRENNIGRLLWSSCCPTRLGSVGQSSVVDVVGVRSQRDGANNWSNRSMYDTQPNGSIRSKLPRRFYSEVSRNVSIQGEITMRTSKHHEGQMNISVLLSLNP